MPRRTVPPPSAETIRVVMVESRTLLGVGVREVLDQETGIEVVAQVRSPDEALPIVEEASPDVILVNVPAAESAATDAARRLHLEAPETAMVVMGNEDHDASLVGAVEIGATGHVAEDAEPHELVATIRAAAEGEDPIKADLTARPDLVERIVDDVRDALLADRRPLNLLTPRELEVLQLVADGLRNREIAEGLGLSEQTIKNHLTSTLHKLGVPNRGAAVEYGVRQGWLSVAVEAEVAVAGDTERELV
ncbi:MAG TPA: response regulator transcription factor [Candidatus Limnocylindrales bacterium]|nr:response regulator transcription factor [Candidatus Limnocylindrales bacterium]